MPLDTTLPEEYVQIFVCAGWLGCCHCVGLRAMLSMDLGLGVLHKVWDIRKFYSPYFYAMICMCVHFILLNFIAYFILCMCLFICVFFLYLFLISCIHLSYSIHFYVCVWQAWRHQWTQWSTNVYMPCMCTFLGQRRVALRKTDSGIRAHAAKIHRILQRFSAKTVRYRRKALMSGNLGPSAIHQKIYRNMFRLFLGLPPRSIFGMALKQTFVQGVVLKWKGGGILSLEDRLEQLKHACFFAWFLKEVILRNWLTSSFHFSWFVVAQYFFCLLWTLYISLNQGVA